MKHQPPTSFSAIDVRKDKKTGESLYQREEILQALLNAPLATILLIDREGILLSINDDGARRLGSTPKALIGRNLFQLLPSEVALRRRPYIEQVFRTGAATRFEDEWAGIQFANSIYPVFAPDGNEVVGVAVFAEDITEQRVSEDKLRESEERFRNMVEQSPLGMEILTPEGQIKQVNPSWMRLWGITEEDAAQVLAEYNMLQDDQLVELGIQQLVEKAFAGQQVVLPPIHYVGERTLAEVGVANPKARTPWIQCHLFPVKNSNGEIINVVNTYMDITEQKQAEESLNAYRERLRALALDLTLTEERERRRIATELHDGAAQSLAFARVQLASASKVVAEHEIAKKLDDVSQILRESLAQIRDVLLDLSSPSMHEIGLGAAISDWLEQQIGGRHGLRTSFSDDSGDLTLDDDVGAVLFRNTRELLTNVVKHAEADVVAVRLECTEEALRISVKDNGAGFEPDDSAETSEGGFGLFSIRELMLDLGGSMEIASQEGEGCEATLVMPFNRAEKGS